MHIFVKKENTIIFYNTRGSDNISLSTPKYDDVVGVLNQLKISIKTMTTAKNLRLVRNTLLVEAADGKGHLILKPTVSSDDVSTLSSGYSS